MTEKATVDVFRQSAIMIAKSLLSTNFSTEEIAKHTDLSVDDVKGISLEHVFNKR